MAQCPMKQISTYKLTCDEEECEWWDELEGRCIVVTLTRKLAVMGNWILLEKVLRSPVTGSGR